MDCIRTNQLCIDILEFSKDRLNKNGVVISKLFMGEDFLLVKDLAKSKFEKKTRKKPQTCLCQAVRGGTEILTLE